MILCRFFWCSLYIGCDHKTLIHSSFMKMRYISNQCITVSAKKTRLLGLGLVVGFVIQPNGRMDLNALGRRSFRRMASVHVSLIWQNFWSWLRPRCNICQGTYPKKENQAFLLVFVQKCEKTLISLIFTMNVSISMENIFWAFLHISFFTISTNMQRNN